MTSLSAHVLQLSGNTLDRYHAIGSAQLPGAPLLRYLTLCLDGTSNSSKSDDLYSWRISLWSNATLRISRDLYLGTCEFDSLNVFELVNSAQDQSTDDAFLYVDIIHRPSGVPIASGSHKVARPNNSIDDNTTSNSSMRLVTSATSSNEVGAFHLQNLTIELQLCDNIKHYPTIASLNYVQKNDTQYIQVSLSVGHVLTNGRADVHEIARNMDHINTVRIVPLYQPSLHDRLHFSTHPEAVALQAEESVFQTDLFGTTHSSFNAFQVGTDGTNEGGDVSNQQQQQHPTVALNKRPWHVTVEDCQLTSDILDLYADRHILITAGSGGMASLAPHIYLGHILRYQGHYIEKAELGVVDTTRTSVALNVSGGYSGPFHTQASDINDLYQSCLNFEVKVMESVETPFVPNRSVRNNSSLPTDRKENNRIDEHMHMEQCTVCVGVLQHARKMDDELSQHTNNANANNILNPTQLTTGRYEVLLYTVYSPDTDLDVTLVGRIVVYLTLPELTLRLPLVPHSEPECFDVQKFQNKNSVDAFVYWCECLNRCCDNIALAEDGIVDNYSFGASNVADSVKSHAAFQALQSLQSLQVPPQQVLQRHRVELQHELQRLLTALTLPQHAEYSTHYAIVCFLLQNDPFRYEQKILPALHTYFQEWLTSEVLSRLMLTETAAEKGFSSNYATPPSPGHISSKPNSRSSTPLPFHSSSAFNTNRDDSPSRALSAQSPEKYLHSVSHSNLMNASGAGASMLRTRSPAKASTKKVAAVGPFDSLPGLDWGSVRAACACVKFIGQSLLVSETNGNGSKREGAYLQTHGDEIASIYSQDDSQQSQEQVSDLLDLPALHEISDDLLCAIVKYLSRTLSLFSAWVNAPLLPDTQLIKHYAMECVQKLTTGMELACLLLPTVPLLSTLTESALVGLTSQLSSLFTVLSNPRWEEEDETFALTLHESVQSFVVPLLQCCAKYASVAHNSTAPMPICISNVCACVDLLQRSILWRSEHHYELLLTLSETVSSMCGKLDERVVEYDPLNDLDSSLLNATMSSDINGGNVWSMREAHNRPAPAPTVTAPTSVRKPRRGNAMAFRPAPGVVNAQENTTGSGNGNGSHQLDTNGYVVATMGAYGGEVSNVNGAASRGGNMFGVDVTLDSSTQAPNSVNASFNPSQQPQGPSVDDTAKAAQVLSAAEMYSEEALLYYIHENHVYFKAVESAVDTLVLLQHQPRKVSAKNKGAASSRSSAEQRSVGVLTAFDKLCGVVEVVLTALCGGNLQEPARLKALIKSSVDSSGVPGKGLVLFIDLYSNVYRKYFDFLASNAALQNQMTPATQDLLSLTLKRISFFQPVFLDILYDHARADKYLSRTAWLSHGNNPTNSNTGVGLNTSATNAGATSNLLTNVVNDQEDAAIQSLSRKLSLHALHPSSANNNSQGNASARTVGNKRAADEYTALAAQRVTKWLQVRQHVQDLLLSAAKCVVRIVQSAETRPALPSPSKTSIKTVATKSAFDFSMVTAAVSVVAQTVTPRLHSIFNTIVTQLCHTCMMHDLGIEGKDIVYAVIAQTPLHNPLQQLWLLAQAIPHSLLEPCHPTGSAHHGYSSPHFVPNADAGAEPYAPLHTLVNTVIDISKLNLELQSAIARMNSDPGVGSKSSLSSLDSTASALAQLLESLSMHTILSSKEGVLFHLKSILKCSLNSYLLVFEDPAWGAQPVILTKTIDGPSHDRRNKSVPHPFAQLMIDTLRLCTEESSLNPALRYLQREYVLHTVNMKLLMCSKHHLMYDDPLLRNAPVQCRLLRSMFEKSFLGASLGNMILFGMCFMSTSSASSVTESALDAPASNDNLFSMVEEINELFRIVPSEKSRSTGQNSSELLSVFGCSFKAYHDLLRLLITHQQETFRVTSTNGLAAVQTLSEIARKLEIEIRQLRHCLQGLLRSGQWEVGVEIANLYLEKYKKLSVAPPPRPPPPPPPIPATPSLLMTPTRSAKSPGLKDRARSPGRTPLAPHATPGSPLPHHRFTYDDEPTSDLRPSSLRAAEESNNASPLPPSSVNQSNAKRYEAIKSELHRVLDTLQNKINANGDLRLLPHYYTVRFVSDTPWERGTEDETLHQALGSFQSECFQCASSAWVHRANTQGGVAESTEADVDPHMGVFEYWLVMKFDTSAYPVCADYYEDVLSLDQQRRLHGGRGQGSDFSLLSPISYHNIQAQLAMAFPAYMMLSSHQMMETYVGEGAFTDHQVGSVKLMQLFQAFPADLCENALSPAVLNALTAIEEAKQATDRVTAQQILDTESLDGLDLPDRDQDLPATEHKNAQETTLTSRTAASTDNDPDLITELKKHTFTALPATRFYAYSIMNDEQVQAMDSYNTHLEAIEKSAYIHRFELAVSESSLDFTNLRYTLAEVSEQQSQKLSTLGAANHSATSTSTAPVSTDPIANLKNRFRSKSNASDNNNVAEGISRKASRFKTDHASGIAGAGENAPVVTSATDAVLQEEKGEEKSGTQSLNVFCVTPVSLALHRNSSCCTPIQVSLEVLYCHMVQLRRAHAAMVKLNEFRRTELANEPLGDVSSSDSIFVGVFTLLSNLLTMPAASCASFTNMETILESEQERIDLEWRAERKAKKQAYLEEVERFEAEKNKETKKWKKLMRPEPTPLDLKALETEFYARPDHAHLKSLQTLHTEAHQLLCRTLQELRAFVMAKDDETAAAPLTAEELRSLAVKRGRRPTVTSMMLQSNLAVHLSDTLANKEESAASPADTPKSLKLKLCLYLESMFASMEIGIPM